MYEINYVKKRKRKKAAAVIAAFSSIGISALCIVAFLGRFVGTFSVTLKAGNIRLTLSEKQSFETQTSFLMVESLPMFEEYTYSAIKKYEAVIDSDQTDYLYGQNVVEGESQSINFFKYTFYVKNVGNVMASYYLKINITDSSASTDGRYLEDTLRVALYHNKADSDEHESTVYAKRSAVAHEDEEGNETFKEYVSTPLYKANASNPFQGFAEEFETDVRIGTISVSGFGKEEVNRYTIIAWLEGQDLQSDERLGTPIGAKLKLGVEINAYEN